LSLIKSAGIEIRNSYEGRFGDAEKLIDYMELVREFDCDKLFITVNMRSFFADDIVKKFIETAMMGYAENNGYEFTKEEVHATIVAGLEELAKSGKNQNFQTWTMK
jgi:CRISPR-associated protein Csn2